MGTVSRLWTTLAAFFLLVALLVPALPARADKLELDDPLARFSDQLLLGGKNLQQAPRRGALTRNMELVGQLRTTIPVSTPGYAGPTSGPGEVVGFNGDVWVHKAESGPAAGKTFAYIGSWGRRRVSNTTIFCPGSAIKIVDITNPASPKQVAEAAAHASTTSEDVEVRRVLTALGEIDLLATGLQRCQNEGLAGADFWNVTDPAAPVFLGFYDVSGRRPGDPVCLDDAGKPAVRGVHEIHIFQKGGRVYALLPAIFREATIAGVSSEENCGPEFIIIDVTDPRVPTFVADWGANQDLGLNPATGLLDRKPNRGDFDRLFAHSVNTTPDRSKAFVSYWDIGAVIFDISGLSGGAAPTGFFDLEAARFGTGGFGPGEEGNTHSAEPAVVKGKQLMLAADEDFVGPPWGFLRIFDITNPRMPVQVGTFQTPHSRGGMPEEEVGAFSIHIPVVQGTKVATAWYSDGVRILDISNPAAPKEKGFLVPSPTPDLFGIFPNNAMVWGATFATIGGKEFIVASDINFGLHVMKETP